MTIFTGALVRETAPFDQVGDLDRRLPAPFPPPQVFAGSDNVAGHFTNTQPIEEIEAQRGGFLFDGFRADFYGRVHILPSVIDVGNLISGQTREVEVWNAYTTTQTLQRIDASGASGIVAPIEPVAFTPLQSRVYDITVSVTGSPEIDARITLIFPNNSPQLRIVGKRVIVWAYEPLYRMTESLEWLTDVLSTRTSEQRLKLRHAPRQTFEYQHVLDTNEFSQAKIQLQAWRHRVFGVPVWHESLQLNSIGANQDTIAIDTTAGDWRTNDMAFIIDKAGNSEVLQTTTLTATGINLKTPTTRNYQNARIMPLRLGALSTVQFQRSQGLYAEVSADFVVSHSVDLGKTTREMYLGKPLVCESSLVGIDETISRDVWQADNEIGIPLALPTQSYPRHHSAIRWFCKDEKALFKLRQWLHYCAGQYRAFWRVSDNVDFTLAETISETATSMTINHVGASLYGAPKHIAIETLDGNRHFANVIRASEADGNTERLHLSQALGVEIHPNAVKRICTLELVRLDSDHIEIQHLEKGMAKVSLPTITVNEE